jgi:hypothetical protein
MLTVATAPGPRADLVPVAPDGRGARNTRMLIPRLSAVTVAVVTGTEGPSQTHIPPDSELGALQSQLHQRDRPARNRQVAAAAPPRQTPSG